MIFGSLRAQLAEAIQAQIALSAGQTEKAKALLAKSIQGMRRRSAALYLPASQALARLFEKEGRLTEAITLLEDAGRARNRDESVRWLGIESQLVLLYRKAGRNAEAQRLQIKLRALLALADTDRPILRRLTFQ